MYLQMAILVISLMGCSSVMPKNGYYVSQNDSLNEGYALRIENDKIQFECNNSDTTYRTPFYKIKNIERNYFEIESIFTEAMWDSWTLTSSSDSGLSNDSIKLEIELPELDCSFYLLVESDATKTNSQEIYTHIFESGKKVTLKLPTPPALNELQMGNNSEDDNKSWGYYLCTLHCNFIWQPAVLLNYPYLPNYITVELRHQPESKTGYTPNKFNLSFKNLTPFILNLPIYRSTLFRTSSKCIYFGSEEFRRL